ncbi:hypothetical protein AAC387_Pa01g0553 [Persea americana]
MKFSSSSSSTPCNGASLQNSNDAAAGCLSGIFRRFLCGNLSVRYFNHSKETDREDTENCQDGVAEEKIKPSPSIVARLMGLDSMPELGSIPLVSNPDSIGRSRSVNSINNWLEFGPNQRLHRRVRPTLSFREVPTFLQEENQDFILLCFGSDGGEKPTMSESKELKSEMGFSEELKADMGFGEVKEKKRESCKSKAKERKKESRAEKKERGRDRRPSSRKIIPEMRIESNSIETGIAMPPSKRDIYKKPISKPPRNHKEIAEIMKLTKKKKGVTLDKRVESNSSSENSSPVSVLDSPFDTHNDFLNDSEAPIISDESRRKLSLASSHGSQIFGSNEKEAKPKNNVDGERKKKCPNSLSSSDVWREICLMAGDDMKKLNWVSVGVSKCKAVEEIGIEFVVQILDSLLHETVEELSQLGKVDLLCKLN